MYSTAVTVNIEFFRSLFLDMLCSKATRESLEFHFILTDLYGSGRSYTNIGWR